MVEAEEHVMIDVGVAAVAAIERTDEVALFASVNIIRANEAEHLAEPIHGLPELRSHQHTMSDPLDMRGALGQPHQLARAQQGILARVELLALGRNRRQCGDAVHNFDLIAVGFSEPHPFAAAGLIDVLNGRGAARARDALEIVLGRGVIGETDEFRRAFLGDMDVMGGIGAAHIEGCVGARRAQHSKPREELLHHIEVGSPKPPVRDVGCLDPSHTSHVSN